MVGLNELLGPPPASQKNTNRLVHATGQKPEQQNASGNCPQEYSQSVAKENRIKLQEERRSVIAAFAYETEQHEERRRNGSQNGTDATRADQGLLELRVYPHGPNT